MLAQSFQSNWMKNFIQIFMIFVIFPSQPEISNRIWPVFPLIRITIQLFGPALPIFLLSFQLSSDKSVRSKLF